MSSDDTSQIRERSARLRDRFTALLVVLWVLLLLERFGAAGLRVVMQSGDIASIRALAVQAVAVVPDTVYLLALAGVRRALGSLAVGQLYGPTVTHMLRRVGFLLAVGAIISAFLVPMLQRALGAGPGYWIAFDVSGLVLGSLGLSLTIIARVMQSAESLRAELAEIF